MTNLSLSSTLRGNPSLVLPFLLILVSSSFSATVPPKKVEKNICQTKECLSTAQNLKESINSQGNPCNGFYEYACGNWPKIHKNTKANPASTLEMRVDQNKAEISDFLKQKNSNSEPEAVHKARKLYSLCLNKAGYSNKPQQIETMLRKIGLPLFSFLSSEETKNFDYTTAIAKATRLAGIKLYFDLSVDPVPYNRTLNMIGLKPPVPGIDSEMLPATRSHKTKRAAITEADEWPQYNMNEVTKRMCRNVTSDSCIQWISANNTARDLVIEKITKQKEDFIYVKDKARPTVNSSSDEIYSLKQLQDLTDKIAKEVNTTIPQLNWTRYIEEMFTGVDDVTLNLSDPTKISITVEAIDFVEDMVRLIYQSNNTKMIELGLWWEVVSTLLPYVDSEMFNLKNSGSKTREEACAKITVSTMGMAISYLYATKPKYIKAKAEIQTMYENIQASLQEIVQQSSWMDEKTRQRTLKKLKSVRSNIVYPNEMKTPQYLNAIYNDTQIMNNFYDTMISIVQNEVTKRLKKLNQINNIHDETWLVSPNYDNSFYHQNHNTMYILAGLVGLSIYNNSLRALDYGAVGAVVGHELSHAFDSEGRHYNEIGNLENWWEPKTSDIYAEKIKCFLDAYSNYDITVGNITLKTDSKITSAEDIPDNIGFKASLLAYRKYRDAFNEEPFLPQFENFTHEQLHTLAFANLWCENPTARSIEAAEKWDVHSPNGVRVNGVLRNSKEFSEIWKCPVGSDMNPDVEKCTVW